MTRDRMPSSRVPLPNRIASSRPRPNEREPSQASPTPGDTGEDVVPPRNLVGASGFVLSIVSLFTAGLLSPFSLIVSLVGLSWSPRLLASIGVVISLMGSGLLVAVTIAVTSAAREAHAQAERKLLQELQQIKNAGPNHKDPRQALDGLIGELHSLPAEDREKLQQSVDQYLDVLQELDRESKGLPPKSQPAPQSPPKAGPSPGANRP